MKRITQAQLLNTFASHKPIEDGWSSDKKYCVEKLDGSKYFLRIEQESKYESTKELFSTLEQIALLDVHICEPIEVGYCADGVYSLQSWVNGCDLKDVVHKMPEEEQYLLGVKAGENLRKIHSINAQKNQGTWAKHFNAKIDKTIKSYDECGLRLEGDAYILDYIKKHRHLLNDRPQSFQHGDYHIGNMMMEEGKLKIIDFNRHSFGDPWEEFNRIVWSAAVSPHFATGQIKGYFEGKPPLDFFKLLSLYIAHNTISSLPWAIKFGQDEIDVMRNQAKDVLKWYDNMQRHMPVWYTS